jgi:hypothetical protein
VIWVGEPTTLFDSRRTDVYELLKKHSDEVTGVESNIPTMKMLTYNHPDVRFWGKVKANLESNEKTT